MNTTWKQDEAFFLDFYWPCSCPLLQRMLGKVVLLQEVTCKVKQWDPIVREEGRGEPVGHSQTFGVRSDDDIRH